MYGINNIKKGFSDWGVLFALYKLVLLQNRVMRINVWSKDVGNQRKGCVMWSFIIYAALQILGYQRTMANSFGGLEVAYWPLVPKFAGSNSTEAVGFFRAKKKILSTPSFGGEVKPSVPCRTLRHVKDPKMAWKSSFRLNLPDNILAHSSTLRY